MDRKISINVNSCLPEMVIAETIYNDYGAVIVWEGTELNLNVIKRLKDLGIEIIQVYESSLPHNRIREKSIPPKKEDTHFTESYEKNTDEFKTILHDLSAGKTSSIEKTHQIVESVYARKDQNREIIDCITQIRKVDEYTYYHSINVSMLSMLIGKWMKLTQEDIRLLTQAGLLHDIGKCRIPPAIINKPDKLDEAEYEEMKKHSEYGCYLVQYMEGMDRRVMEAILYHHERYDGSGYPVGLTGTQIPLFARIVGVADTFDAMTANRPYRLKTSPFSVFELMQNGCFGYLDPVVLNAFLLNISYYYIGSKVRLSDGRIAEVVYINRQLFGKPVLKIGEEYLDMSVARNLNILEML